MTAQQLSLLEPSNARARKQDPRTSKRAAAWNPEGRSSQAARILRWLWTHDRITADTAWRELTAEGEDVTRGEWSARLGMLCSKARGRLLEKGGEVDDIDRKGRPTRVLSYSLTDAGRAEVARMFGRVQ